MRVDGGSDISGAVTATIVAAITLVMALVGLVAAAGFVVVAQRRQRQLGLLSAISASARQLRLVMIMNGAIVGTVAAIAVQFSASSVGSHPPPWLEWGEPSHRPVRAAVDVDGDDAAHCSRHGHRGRVVAARVVSRLSVMAALSGRPSRRGRCTVRSSSPRSSSAASARSPPQDRPATTFVRSCSSWACSRSSWASCSCHLPRSALAVPARRLPFAPASPSRPGALPGPGGRRARARSPSVWASRSRSSQSRGPTSTTATRATSPTGSCSSSSTTPPRNRARRDRVRAEPARRPSGDGRGRNRQRCGGRSARPR